MENEPLVMMTRMKSHCDHQGAVLTVRAAIFHLFHSLFFLLAPALFASILGCFTNVKIKALAPSLRSC